MIFRYSPTTAAESNCPGALSVEFGGDECAFENIGLFRIIWRHRDLAREEALIKSREDLDLMGGGETKRAHGAASRVRSSLRQGPRPPEKITISKYRANGGLRAGEVLNEVSNDGFESDLDAEIIELRCEGRGFASCAGAVLAISEPAAIIFSNHHVTI